ncbi:hypothetical protein H206_05164 [Candidatus Electrothrix aarhusensis]|uniref:Uncharacterized protein n=1 Tax=Candidatus Electrothrix aarhusensis TaxID=1859131 RepID=A0A444J5E2_9BACT|nr:hypothetical protein H206_05164 [Candidatus Electrothrix aarhusensis]
MSTPWVDLGWRKPICLPPAPVIGVVFINRQPAFFAFSSWAAVLLLR